MVSAAAASALSLSLSRSPLAVPALQLRSLSLIHMLLTAAAAAIEKKLLADNVGKRSRRS